MEKRSLPALSNIQLLQQESFSKLRQNFQVPALKFNKKKGLYNRLFLAFWLGPGKVDCIKKVCFFGQSGEPFAFVTSDDSCFPGSPEKFSWKGQHRAGCLVALAVLNLNYHSVSCCILLYLKSPCGPTRFGSRC